MGSEKLSLLSNIFSIFNSIIKSRNRDEMGLREIDNRLFSFWKKETMFKALSKEGKVSQLVKELAEYYGDTLPKIDEYRHLSYKDKLFTDDIWHIGLTINKHFPSGDKSAQEIVTGTLIAFHLEEEKLLMLYEEKGVFCELSIGKERNTIKWQGFDAFGKSIDIQEP